MAAALALPAGLLAHRPGEATAEPALAEARRAVERATMEEVMRAERALGCTPRDVSALNQGWDVESLDPRDGSWRLIEVKGRVAGADTVTITSNEVVAALNRTERWILALVEVTDGFARGGLCPRLPAPRAWPRRGGGDPSPARAPGPSGQRRAERLDRQGRGLYAATDAREHELPS